MSTIILAILLLFMVIGELRLITSRVRKNAFQWWHTPWFALIYVIIIYLLYHLIELPDTFLLNWLFEEYKIETFYCLVGMVVWVPIQAFLRKPSVHKSLINTYRSFFDQDDEKTKRKLPFPYYYSSDGEMVKSRVGRVFYRLALKSVIIIVAIVYAIALVVAHFYPDLFFPSSAFGILSLIPFIEYFFYLCAEVDNEQTTTIEDGGEQRTWSNFDALWQLFVENYDNYAVAWKRNFDEKGTIRLGYEKDNFASFEDLFTKFKDEHRGGIIEDCDLLTAFSKLVPFFMQVIKSGHYILVLFDIPRHFSTTKQNSYIKEIASQLTSMLVKRFPKINEITEFIVYDETSTLGVFDNSIVMSPLSVLARQDMKDKEWMKNLGLITVVNVFDKGVSNLYENRWFSQILKTVNQHYQILVISSFRKDLESSLEQTWVTTQEKHFPDGCKMVLYPRSERQFFIGYNFEEWTERYEKVLFARPNDKLYSGSEMLVFPLTEAVGDEKKTVTPVHQLDLAYTNTLEGNEEFSRFVTYFKDHRIEKDSVFRKVKPHILPIDEIIEPQVFSIIYDNENNAATSYMKWIHLGNEENFSIVISKPYLFRDYFNANHHFFANAPFSALQPCMCNCRITLAIILLNMLKDGEQDENTIKSHLLKYYKSEEIVSVPDKLKELFSIYFSDDLAKDLRTKDEVVFDGTKYQTHIKFRLVHPDRINLPYLDVITVKDENGNVLFDILRDLLYQNYIKNQHHSFSGLPYIITDYDQVNKTLDVTRSKISNELFCKVYYHIEVRFDENTLPIKGINMEEPVIFYHHTGVEMAYKMEAYETYVHIKPLELIAFENSYKAPSFSSGSSTRQSVDQDSTPSRSYTKGKVLKLSLKYLNYYSDSIEKIRKMLQILFYEGIQSLFPHHSQYLIVASVGKGDPDLPWIFNDFVSNDETRDGWLSFYFIEDAHIDLGLIGALTYDNISYLMRYIFDYLIWLTEEPSCPEGYIDYLNRKDFDKLSFLKYGREDLPDYFKIDLIINFIRDQFTTKDVDLMQMQQNRLAHNNIIGTCDFCRTKMRNSEMQRLNDGRMRCPECAKDAVDTNEQFKALCEKVKEAFLTHLNLDFNKIAYKAKLVSAVELHKVGDYNFSITNGYDIRKLIGLARDRNVDEFYIEDGYKSDETFGTIAHEMTHIWEYNDADFKKMRKTNEDLVEGLAVWTDLYLTEKYGATKMEDRMDGWINREDEYGRGLRFIMENCPDDPYRYIKEEANKI